MTRHPWGYPDKPIAAIIEVSFHFRGLFLKSGPALSGKLSARLGWHHPGPAGIAREVFGLGAVQCGRAENLTSGVRRSRPAHGRVP